MAYLTIITVLIGIGSLYLERYISANKAEQFEIKTDDILVVEKDRIDQWLTDNNLNSYGDSKDTVYTGGNPLFDEATGEMKDRYEYLIQKFPKKPWDN